MAAHIEDAWQVPIDVVTVGEAQCEGESAHALLAATREAITNAARHGREDVRVFAEFTSECWEVYVRDRGPGFNLEAIPADRRGVRDSIHARMRRHGGSAHIRTAERGTEVHLILSGAPQREEQWRS